MADNLRLQSQGARRAQDAPNASDVNFQPHRPFEADGRGRPHLPNDIEYRTLDGSGNNALSPALNAAGTDFNRMGPANFADGVHEMMPGPNPRTISNVVVAGHGDLANPEGFSGMMYAWGQFVDHDLDLTLSDGATAMNIIIPPNDPVLTASAIPMTRAVIDPATGHDGKPATAVNAISGWLDASMVYGSSKTTADSLRLPDGHMKTSSGNYLPVSNGQYLAGDVRVQENPDLTALQTLFMREHNYWVDQLKQDHPRWTGDQLYDQARAIVGAEIQHITYSEFLTKLLGPNAIAQYRGYNAGVDPRITEEFAGAAFRFGHSLVSAEITKFGEQGQELAAEDLKAAFFETPEIFQSAGGADALLRHLASDASNAMDVHIVDDLRNFLDAPPAAMDLAAINIQRGRDLGLGTLNQTRVALGLNPYSSFEQITHDAETVAALRAAYGNNINSVDLWTGGLSEEHMAGAMIGQTFGKIIAKQFTALRDGDRLWYQNQGFDAKTLAAINHTTLGDIIDRDTDTGHIQDDVFTFYERHSGVAGGIASENPNVPQLVVGSDGADRLVGGPKGDILVAGSGNQVMTGLAGSDEFIISKTNANVRIMDFQPGKDSISFEPKFTLKDLHIAVDRGGNTVIDIGTDHIVLVGINPHSLVQAHDFAFHA